MRSIKFEADEVREVLKNGLLRRGVVDNSSLYKVGERLWVREVWYDDLMRSAKDVVLDDNIYYAADGKLSDQVPEYECAEGSKSQWRPSIFMPRNLSRIIVKVIEVHAVGGVVNFCYTFQIDKNEGET